MTSRLQESVAVKTPTGPARSNGLPEPGVAYPNQPSHPGGGAGERPDECCQVARVRATNGIGRVVFVWYSS